MPERRRQQGRRNSYSDTGHSYRELTRKEQKQQRRAERDLGIIPPADSSEINPKPTDMEPGKDYRA